MKRLSSCDSPGAFLPICPSSTVDEQFASMLELGLDDEEQEQQSGQVSDKKVRRLSVDQVKALERNFEVENKLEPERKLKLAEQLGLQPRQVAVWFQNRRARWKTKQLERDYGVLMANHDALKIKYQSLQRDNNSLLNQIRELKLKLNEEGRNDTVKEEEDTPLVGDAADKGCRNEVIIGDLRDGSSDSDSSAILNEDNFNNNSPHQKILGINHGKNNSASLLRDYKAARELVVIEEHNFLGEDTSCTSFFSDDEAPTLHWCCSADQISNF